MMKEVKMPAISTISTYLTKAAATFAFKRMAVKGAKGLVEWIKEKAHEDDVSLTDRDLKTINGLVVGNKEAFQVLLAKIVPWTSSGAICAGPSGSGKTSILNFFVHNRLITPTQSTSRTDPQTTRYGAWTYQMTDTPDQHGHTDSREDAFSAIKDGKEKVLMLVFAGGFLKTVGIIDAEGYYVASQYDSLYENAPSGGMSLAAVELSVRLLRAQVRVRFLER